MPSTYQITYNGLTIGAGTKYVITGIQGLAGLMPLRVQDDNRGYQDATWSGRDFYDARTVEVSILILGDNTKSAQSYYLDLQSAFAPQQLGYPDALTLFQFKLSSDMTSKRMYGRIRAIDTMVDAEFTYGYIVANVTFYFPDPRYYDETLNTVSVGTSATAIANAGWATTLPTITIASPAASFSINDTVTAVTMYFSNVQTGYPVVIDLLNRTITNNGYARNIMTASTTDWLYVPGNTTGQWSISTGTMSVAWRSAYV
jgi:hypothetical protein